MTRAHTDVDLVTWTRRAARVRSLLTSQDYRLVKSTEVQSIFEKSGQDVDVSFFKKDLRDRRVTPGFEDGPWPAGAFTERRGRIRDVRFRVITPHALLEEKESYFAYMGMRLRAKDRRSIRQLRSCSPDYS